MLNATKKETQVMTVPEVPVGHLVWPQCSFNFSLPLKTALKSWITTCNIRPERVVDIVALDLSVYPHHNTINVWIVATSTLVIVLES